MPLQPLVPFAADGAIERKSIGQLHDIDGAPAMNMRLVVPFADDAEEGRARDLYREDGAVSAVLRSSYAQVGLHIRLRGEVDFSPHQARVPVTLSSHRGAVRDHLLTVLRTLVKEGRQRITPGGLLFVPPDSALSRDEITEELDRQRLLLPDGSTVDEDGTVSLPLHQGYAFAEQNFDEEAMRRLLRDGRHSMQRLRKAVPLPRYLPDRGFLLANVRGLSLGYVQGIIQQETNMEGVTHLPALVLDPIRTMGTRIPRQAEVRNATDSAVPTDQLRILLRLHHTNDTVRAAATRVVNPRSLREGADLHDLVSPEQFVRLADLVSPRRSASDNPEDADFRPHGLLLGRGRAAEIAWSTEEEFQDAHILSRARQFVAANPADRGDGWVDGQGIPEPARSITAELGHVSQDHHGKVLITHGFPDPQTARELLREGIGVFVARGLHREEGAYAGDTTSAWRADGEPTTNDATNMKRHALFFDTARYEAMRERAKEGATYFLVLPDMVDEMSGGDMIPAHVREFDRGLWVKPEAKEALRKVRTVIAMYGSHVEGMDPVLLPQLQVFMREMKELFGEEVALTHGKGPGVMKMADDAAAEAGILRMGVGICVEGQAGNCRPEAMVDFSDTDRLRRQKLMDDLATFKVFNLGGAGTLEEAAITLCSQKLGKKAITPIIFVDPVGAGRDGKHLWAELQEQIRTLAEQKTLMLPDSNNILVRFLQEETPQYIHCVGSYAEATDIIRAFARDPAAYYRDGGIPDRAVSEALERQTATLAQTGFPAPSFLQRPDPASAEPAAIAV